MITGFRLIWVMALLVAVSVSIQSCATGPKRAVYTSAEGEKAHIPGITMARFWGDTLPPRSQLVEAVTVTKLQIRQTLSGKTPSHMKILAISGGGANGAFGAGLLAGWTEAGDRPTFQMVTGISTGSLIAPFAFLGPKYDDKMKYFYTSVTTEDIATKRSVFSILSSDAVADTAPLRKLIAEVYDRQMMEEIAAEWAKGRRLFIGTTNLDAERPVIWRLGSIAASGHPRSLDLIHEILLASASIPGAFPPVYIEVESGGRSFQEMHVDGGVASQVFLYPVSMDFRKLTRELGFSGQHQMYVIRNSTIKPDWKFIEPKLFPIASRSIASLIRTQGIGDLYRIYLGAMRDNLDYNLAYIPSDVELPPAHGFDPVYMKQLFDLGYKMASGGYPWEKAPPGFDPPQIQ